MIARTTVPIIASMLCLAGSAAHAVLIDPTIIDRNVQVQTSGGKVQTDGVGVTPFNASVGGVYADCTLNASQNSSISDTQIAVSGSVSSSVGNLPEPPPLDLHISTYGWATSSFTERFTITEDTPISFTCDFTNAWGVGQVKASLRLVDGPYKFYYTTTHLIESSTWSYPYPLGLVPGPILAPGQYDFTISAGIGASRQSASYSAVLTLTPEPASSAMFGLASLLLVWRSRGRKA